MTYGVVDPSVGVNSAVKEPSSPTWVTASFTPSALMARTLKASKTARRVRSPACVDGAASMLPRTVSGSSRWKTMLSP